MELDRIGRGVRALRHRRRWRQSDLAASAKVSRPVVGRIESGESREIAVGVLERVVLAAGGSLEVFLRYQGETLDRLLDESHARLVEAVVGRLRALGWEVAVEVTFSRYGERGSIDILAWHPPTRALAVFEVKSVTPDMQAMLSGLDRKVRLASAIARERGWDPSCVARILVLGDGSTNRRRLARFAGLVSTVLPGGTWDVRHWLGKPSPPGVAGVWFLAGDRTAGRTGGGRHRVRVTGGSPRTRQEPDSAE
ncbi:MAG: helix-turn-helix domain-containing protein [Candidatus Limnocylindrales bacterium]